MPAPYFSHPVFPGGGRSKRRPYDLDGYNIGRSKRCPYDLDGCNIGRGKRPPYGLAGAVGQP